MDLFPDYTDIQVGQGFFVLANYNNVPFSFTPEMQTHSTLTPMTKSAKAKGNPWPGLQLKVKFGEKERLTVIVYNNKMTAGLDPGYDIGQLSTGPEVEIYTLLAGKDNSVNFAQQALPLTDLSRNIVPVGIDSEKGGEVTFSAFTVPIGNNRFWLEDRTDRHLYRSEPQELHGDTSCQNLRNREVFHPRIRQEARYAGVSDGGSKRHPHLGISWQSDSKG